MPAGGMLWKVGVALVGSMSMCLSRGPQHATPILHMRSTSAPDFVLKVLGFGAASDFSIICATWVYSRIFVCGKTMLPASMNMERQRPRRCLGNCHLRRGRYWLSRDGRATCTLLSDCKTTPIILREEDSANAAYKERPGQ